MRLSLLLGSLVLAGCGTSATCPTSNTLTYDSFGQAFITSFAQWLACGAP